MSVSERLQYSREHTERGQFIEELKRTVLQLNDELMEEDDVRVRNALESRARAADEALQHFLIALQLEQRVHDKE